MCNKLAPAWEELAKSMKRIKTATIDVTERDSKETKLVSLVLHDILCGIYLSNAASLGKAVWGHE